MLEEEALASACSAHLEGMDGENVAYHEEGQKRKYFFDQKRPLWSYRHLHYHEKKQNQRKQTQNEQISAKQRQIDREFLSHKRQLMANLTSNACDHSPKGAVDRNCLPLMHVLNTHDDYVTTSSCSGRIALFHSVSFSGTQGACVTVGSAGVKRGNKDALGWLVVKHGVLTEQEIDVLVCCLCGDIDGGGATIETVSAVASEKKEKHDELGGVWVREGVFNVSPLPSFGTIALKMEPFVMHVECRTMESAKLLLSAAVADAGFRNSGVTPPGKKTMCAIRHASGLGLDVPLVVDGVNHVTGQHAYVRRLLELANEKMRANDGKLHRLEAAVAARLYQQNKTCIWTHAAKRENGKNEM